MTRFGGAQRCPRAEIHRIAIKVHVHAKRVNILAKVLRREHGRSRACRIEWSWCEQLSRNIERQTEQKTMKIRTNYNLILERHDAIYNKRFATVDAISLRGVSLSLARSHLSFPPSPGEDERFRSENMLTSFVCSHLFRCIRAASPISMRDDSVSRDSEWAIVRRAALRREHSRARAGNGSRENVFKWFVEL